MNRSLFAFFLGLTAGSAIAAVPDYAPPFSTGELKKQTPILKTTPFVAKQKSWDQPSINVGNKRISIREVNGSFRHDLDHSIRIFVDHEEIMSLIFWGTWHNGGLGFPFKDLPDGKKEMTHDAKTNSFRWVKEYLLPNGERAFFSYQVKPAGESRVELSWDLGIPQEKLNTIKDGFHVSFWFSSKTYKDAGMKIDGKNFDGKTKKELLSQKKTERLIQRASKIEFHPGNPAKSVTLELPDYLLIIEESGKFDQMTKKESFNLFVRTEGKKLAKNSVILDFGKAKVANRTSPPVNGGIDFWKRDAMHVPLSPVRNRMPNPSFEQGLRYWTWQNGGADNSGRSEIPRYSIDDTVAHSGKNSLLISPVQNGAAAMQSFVLPLEKNKPYTVSFYAKSDKPKTSVNFGFFSVTDGGKFKREYSWAKRFELSPEWKRFSYTETADGAGTALTINAGGGGKVWIDDIQLEESPTQTDFSMPPAEGRLFTSNPDNTMEAGNPINAAFEISGKKGIKLELTLTLSDFYREKLFSKTFQTETGKKIELPLESFKNKTGFYVLKAEFNVPGFKPYTDYFRFNVLKSLSNTHPSKILFSTLIADFFRASRGEEVGRLYQRSGFGGTSYAISSKVMPEEYRIQTKYGIENFLMLPEAALSWKTEKGRALRKFWGGIKQKTQITDADAKEIEENAYQTALEQTNRKYWSILTESEGSPILRAGKFDEWFKAQSAFARGIKRAIPDAKLFPCGGTSGWSMLRGFREMNGYLNSAKKHNFKWDAIAVHPYWDLDGTKGFYDLDTETARLIDVMKKYGYGTETPIFFTEGFNIPNVHVPEWNAGLWNDPYCGNRPTYDTGLREFIQASLASRTFLISMKYWPRVKQFNIWEARLYFDQYLTPKGLCFAVNTLGHLFPDPVYIADIRPANGVRGYVFTNKGDDTPIAALWCTIDKVEDGFERGPILRIKFDGPAPELIDLMGNKREWKSEKDGFHLLQLTPAPLFLKGGNPEKLSKLLANSEVIGSDSNTAVSFYPTEKGVLNAKIRNLTGREQKGTLSTDSGKNVFSLSPASEQTIALPEKTDVEFGKMFRWNKKFNIALSNGSISEKQWNMDYFYVPYTKGTPDWTAIPAIPISNLYFNSDAGKEKNAPPLKAKFQTAWNEKGFYLRVEADDPNFEIDPKRFQQPGMKNNLYILDGALEVYFDCGANGRTNIKKGYDLDDYRYDFSCGNAEGKTGIGLVNRLRAVNWQFAGGLDMPTKEQASKNIKTIFTRTSTGYVYEITFEPKYLEPIRLEPGFLSGFALYLHNHDPNGKYSALSTATESGAHCDYNPHLWPLMIFAK